MAKSISADKRENEKKRLARRAEKQKKKLEALQKATKPIALKI